jgi:hypothetical protein
MKDDIDENEMPKMEEQEAYRPVTIEGLIRVISILFVLGIYVVFILKILILE